MNNQLLLLIISVAIVGFIVFYSSNSTKNKVPKLEIEDSNEQTPIQQEQETQTQPQRQDEKPEATIVLFYAPWCGYCKSIMPLWDNLSRKYPNLEKVDCDANKQVGQEQNVKSFPTIRAYVGDEMVQEYKGDRSPGNLEQFILSF